MSHPLERYYGLICASSRLSPIYVLDGESLPNGWRREGPHFQLRVCLSVPPSVPRWTERVQLAVSSPLVQAFAISGLARHPHPRARRFSHGSVSRLQSSLHAAARQVARPSPTRTFTLELSPPESPPQMSSMTTRAHSQLPRPDLHRQHTQHCGLRPETADGLRTQESSAPQ